MSDRREIEFQMLVLDKLKVFASAEMSREFALLPEAEFAIDHMVQRLVLRLKAQVLEDRRYASEGKMTFVEQPVYRTWKQHLVASLPEQSFRRRFLERLWEIDEPNGTRIVHEVTHVRRAVFPGNTAEYPKELGRVQFVVQTSHNSWSEDPNDELL